MDDVFQDLILYQQKKLLKAAQNIIPNITPDDLLQPQDYPELEFHPEFRYEEGILAGILAAQAALRAN